MITPGKCFMQKQMSYWGDTYFVKVGPKVIEECNFNSQIQSNSQIEFNLWNRFRTINAEIQKEPWIVWLLSYVDLVSNSHTLDIYFKTVRLITASLITELRYPDIHTHNFYLGRWGHRINATASLAVVIINWCSGWFGWIWSDLWQYPKWSQ